MKKVNLHPGVGTRTAFLVICLASRIAGQSPPYLNPDLPAEARASDVISRFTLSEKVGQMQNEAPAIPRLSIPAYDWWSEALHGVARAGIATAFPQAIGLSASFDFDLMTRVASVISTEARAKYNRAQRQGDSSRYHGLTFFSPNINLFRDPRWGRGQETYGEDPFLTAQMATAFITGMQGSDSHYWKTVATAKHFAVHSGPEPARHTFDAVVSEDDLTNTYLAAFRAAVQVGGVGSLMCAYNSVNGAPVCASTDLLGVRLRQSWGFAGYVVSDCGAISDIANGHHYAPGIPEASALAVRAGVDLSCGAEFATLTDAVSRGLVAEADLDRSLIRLFTTRFRLGMFDPPERVPYSAIADTEIDSAAHRAVALEAAQRSLVLLKNSGPILPLSASVKSIAVVGPSADWPDMQLGNYSGTPSRIVTPLDGMRQRFGATARVTFALGSTYTGVSPALVPTDVLQSPTAQSGLLAEYFATPDLSGAPAVSRLDPRIYFNWDSQDPAIVSAIPHDEFSVRWTGTLTAPYTGEYVLGLAHGDCSDCTGTQAGRIYLDGTVVVDENSPQSWLHETRGARVQFAAGSVHQLRIEYRQDHGNKDLELVWIPPAGALLAEARSTMASADVVALFIGINDDLENEESPLQLPGFVRGDRTSLDLPDPQQQLLRAALDSSRPVVVVLTSGSAIVAAGAQEEAAAIVESWYPGEEGGTAIARALAGDDNPSGRLPVTFYRSVGQLPAFDDYAMAGRTYRFFQGDPLYHFGYGLSYSTFRYSRLTLPRLGSGPGPHRVSAQVANVSRRDGDEVVQLYVGRGRALPALAGVKRVHLAAGAHALVEFTLDASLLAAGEPVTITVGGGQPVSGASFVQGGFRFPR
jgi:beta-glucosidase